MLYTCVLPVKGRNVYALDECIEAALQNNVRVRNADNNLKMADHDKKEVFTKYFSTVSAVCFGFIANEPCLLVF